MDIGRELRVIVVEEEEMQPEIMVETPAELPPAHAEKE